MGTLQVVATPIGNLEDITLRAIRTLAEADVVFAEDTRRTRVLLDRHGIDARPLSLHEHNEASRVEEALSTLRRDGQVALVSDAGTPLISDPGSRLVDAVIADGHRVEPIPGASAVSSALSVSGLPTSAFTFVGFLPRKAGECRALLEAHRDRTETLVCFESPRRVAASLRLILDVLGDRRACVARELTKLHEEVARGPLSELVEHFASEVRGELTLLVEGADESEGAATPARELLDEVQLDAAIRSLLEQGKRPREIAATLAARTASPRRQIYSRVIALKEGS